MPAKYEVPLLLGYYSDGKSIQLSYRVRGKETHGISERSHGTKRQTICRI